MLSLRSHQKPTVQNRRQLRATLRQVSDHPEILAGQHVIICVSIGQSVHYGAHLQATYELVTNINEALKTNQQSTIRSITLSVNGTLQRHNFWYFACNEGGTGNHIKPLNDQQLQELLLTLPEELSEESFAKFLAEKFYPYALAAEKDFIKQNEHLLFNHTPLSLLLHRMTYKTVGWDDWLHDPRYAKAYAEFSAQYHDNKPFFLEEDKKTHYPQDDFKLTTAAIFHSGNQKKITEAAQRMKKIRPELAALDFTKVAECASLTYLKEECPILPGPVWAGYHIIYPNPMTPAFKATAAMTGTAVNWHILNFKRIDNEPRQTICALVDQESHSPQKEDEEKNQQQLVDVKNTSSTGNTIDITRSLLAFKRNTSGSDLNAQKDEKHLIKQLSQTIYDASKTILDKFQAGQKINIFQFQLFHAITEQALTQAMIDSSKESSSNSSRQRVCYTPPPGRRLGSSDNS